MRRRDFITSFAATTFALSSIARAQRSKKPIIAYLSGTAQTISAPYLAQFLRGMREAGNVEGRDFDMIYRYTDGYQDRAPAQAEEVIRLGADIIFATGVISAVPAKKLTSTIPIVCPTLADAVHLGLIASEARPVGNVTGIAPYVEGLPSKQIELAREIVPGAGTIGLLTDLKEPKAAPQVQQMEATARALKINVVTVGVNQPEDIEGALQKLASERVDVVIVLQSSMFLRENKQITASALSKRVPTVYGYAEHVRTGGLISYGVDLFWCWYRGAYFVDKILHGARPADLPVEFPTKLLLVINGRTAKALGLTIPPTLLVRADDVIE
jgi:putative tryptophan/tyrosine transport system substrate-binding protein